MKPRPLLIAEAANPEWVSVHLVGWSQCDALRALTGAHIVTQIRNRDAFCRAGLVEGRDFTAIDSESVTRPAFALRRLLGAGSGKGWTIGAAVTAVTYPWFEHLIWQRFGGRIRSGEFNIVHRVTPLSPAVPSLIGPRCREAGAAFILGPLNGGVPWPRGFEDALIQEREWLSYVRDGYKLLPGYHATRRSASAIFIASRDTWRQMPRQYHDKCHYLPENGIDPARFARQRSRSAVRPIRAVFIGRLVPYKGADMLLRAAAGHLRDGAMTLQVIGDGPQMPQLRELADREGIAEFVHFTGWLPHHLVQEHLAEADLFTFPSIREFGGGVVLEAMAVGCVPVVADYGGPAELVNEQTGFRIPMGTPEQIIHRLRELLGRLIADPALIDKRSAPAIQRVLGQFTWEAKAQRIAEVYRRCLEGSEYAAAAEHIRGVAKEEAVQP